MIHVGLFRSQGFEGISPHLAETLSPHWGLGVTVVIYENGIGAYAGSFASAMSHAAIVCGVTALCPRGFCAN